MSIIGRKPVVVPAGVEVTVDANNVVTVKGPKGTLVKQLSAAMIIEQDGAVVNVKRPSDEKEHKALHGLTRTLLNNMVVGVSEGYQKTLEIVGVGYRVAKTGKSLSLVLGYSHGITIDETDTIKFEVPDPNKIIVRGIDKQVVGQFAAEVRGKRPPEPYKGKGIKYTTEVIRRKVGKTGGKK